MKKEKALKILEMIMSDVENDVKEFEGAPFNGKTVASYFGKQAAAIYTIAKIQKELIVVQTKENKALKEELAAIDKHVKTLAQ